MRLLFWLPSWWPRLPLVVAQSAPQFDPADWVQLGGTAAAVGIAFAWVQSERRRADRAEAALADFHEERHRDDQMLLARMAPTLERSIGTAKSVEESVRNRDAPLSQILLDLQRAAENLKDRHDRNR